MKQEDKKQEGREHAIVNRRTGSRGTRTKRTGNRTSENKQEGKGHEDRELGVET